MLFVLTLAQGRHGAIRKRQTTSLSEQPALTARGPRGLATWCTTDDRHRAKILHRSLHDRIMRPARRRSMCALPGTQVDISRVGALDHEWWSAMRPSRQSAQVETFALDGDGAKVAGDCACHNHHGRHADFKTASDSPSSRQFQQSRPPTRRRRQLCRATPARRTSQEFAGLPGSPPA
jgi:hypothetical protein